MLRSARQHDTSAVVLVCGPAGIGKTALLTEICAQATRMSIRVAWNKCDPAEEVCPGAAVIAALRTGRYPMTTASEYEQIAGAAAEPLLIADRIASRLECLASVDPLLIAIDDFQWADRVSQFLLRTLMSRLVGLPVVWLLASRDNTIRHGLAGHDIGRREYLQLAPLSMPDLASMAADRLGRVPDARARRYLEATGGNPSLASQVIDILACSTAAGEPDIAAREFAAVLSRRLACLPRPALELTELVAVAGGTLAVRDAMALLPSLGSGSAKGGVADAVESGLINVSARNLTFFHDLARETVYATLPDRCAGQLHARLAAYHLEVLGEPLAAAFHARAAVTAGDLSSAQVLVSAADALAGSGAGDTGELAELAFAAVPPARPEWLDLSQRCLSILSAAQHAAQAITVADRILARIDDPNVAARVETEAARALWLSRRSYDLTTRIERLLRSSELDTGAAARVRAAYALARTRTLPSEAAASEAADAVARAHESGDGEALSLAVQAAGEAARNQGRHQQALLHFRELRTLTPVPYLAEEITALQFVDRYDHAGALLAQARASCPATQALLPGLSYAQMWQDFCLGSLGAADSGAHAMIKLGRQLGLSGHVLDAISVRGAVALFRGEAELADAHLRLADQLTNAGQAAGEPSIALVRGWLAAKRGDLPGALDTLRPVLRGAQPDLGHWPLRPCWNGLLYRIGAAAGDDNFTASCVDVAEANAARNPGVPSFEGIALNLRGQGQQDLTILAEAAQILSRSPRPILRAIGAESYGRALLAAGLGPEAMPQLDQAWDEYHRMGAWTFRANVQRIMRQAGARRPKWTATATATPATGWGSLTGAERRVAALISDGHTNKSAASALGVSTNTVGTHLRAVFTKLGVRSRVELANRLARDATSTPID